MSGDGRRAVAIPPSAIPVAAGTGAVATAHAPGVSPGSLTLHDLESARWLDPRTVARRTEILSGGTCWLTRNGRFLLVWGGGEGAKIWDMESAVRGIFFPQIICASVRKNTSASTMAKALLSWKVRKTTGSAS